MGRLAGAWTSRAARGGSDDRRRPSTGRVPGSGVARAGAGPAIPRDRERQRRHPDGRGRGRLRLGQLALGRRLRRPPARRGRARRPRAAPVARALGQRRPDGAVLLPGRAGDQARAAGRRARRPRERATLPSSRRSAAWWSRRRSTPGSTSAGPRRGLGRADGDRHRLRGRRAGPARPARAGGAEGVPAGARHRRRHRRRRWSSRCSTPARSSLLALAARRGWCCARWRSPAAAGVRGGRRLTSLLGVALWSWCTRPASTRPSPASARRSPCRCGARGEDAERAEARCTGSSTRCTPGWRSRHAGVRAVQRRRAGRRRRPRASRTRSRWARRSACWSASRSASSCSPPRPCAARLTRLPARRGLAAV